MRLSRSDLDSLSGIGSLYESGVKPPYTREQVARQIKALGLGTGTDFAIKYPVLGVPTRHLAREGLIGLVRRKGELYIYPGEFIVENPGCIGESECQGEETTI